ncbi:MAG: hypothetical protein LLG08_03425 [Actinomycetia bacterium]|nr:hypothetical protein [Actinomycetes bacterium]
MIEGPTGTESRDAALRDQRAVLSAVGSRQTAIMGWMFRLAGILAAVGLLTGYARTAVGVVLLVGAIVCSAVAAVSAAVMVRVQTKWVAVNRELQRQSDEEEFSEPSAMAHTNAAWGAAAWMLADLVGIMLWTACLVLTDSPPSPWFLAGGVVLVGTGVVLLVIVIVQATRGAREEA